MFAKMCMKTQGLMGNSTNLNRNCMSMMIKDLMHQGGSRSPQKIPLKFDRKAGMLLKTHVEKMSAQGLAKIFMKIKGLCYSCQDMYEKKGTWLRPKSKTRDGACLDEPLAPRPGDWTQAGVPVPRG